MLDDVGAFLVFGHGSDSHAIGSVGLTFCEANTLYFYEQTAGSPQSSQVPAGWIIRGVGWMVEIADLTDNWKKRKTRERWKCRKLPKVVKESVRRKTSNEEQIHQNRLPLQRWLLLELLIALGQSLMKNPRGSLLIPLFKNLILYAGKGQLIELSSNFNHVPPYNLLSQ